MISSDLKFHSTFKILLTAGTNENFWNKDEIMHLNQISKQQQKKRNFPPSLEDMKQLPIPTLEIMMQNPKEKLTRHDFP